MVHFNWTFCIICIRLKQDLLIQFKFDQSVTWLIKWQYDVIKIQFLSFYKLKKHLQIFNNNTILTSTHMQECCLIIRKTKIQYFLKDCLGVKFDQFWMRLSRMYDWLNLINICVYIRTFYLVWTNTNCGIEMMDLLKSGRFYTYFKCILLPRHKTSLPQRHTFPSRTFELGMHALATCPTPAFNINELRGWNSKGEHIFTFTLRLSSCCWRMRALMSLLVRRRLLWNRGSFKSATGLCPCDLCKATAAAGLMTHSPTRNTLKVSCLIWNTHRVMKNDCFCWRYNGYK